MHGAVQTQLVRATRPQDQGSIPSPVVSRSDVALSPSILQAGGSREHQVYLKVGYAGSPGLLCGAASALRLLSPCKDARCSTSPASARCRLAAGGFWRRGGSGCHQPCLAPHRTPGHCGEAAHSIAVPAGSAARVGQSSAGPRGPLLFGSSRAGSAAPPVPQRVNKQFPLLTARETVRYRLRENKRGEAVR